MSQGKYEPNREESIRLFAHLESALCDSYRGLSDARYYAKSLGMDELAKRLSNHMEEVVRASHGSYDPETWKKYRVKEDEICTV